MPEEINELQNLVEDENEEQAPEMEVSGKSTFSVGC
jgi:hypothetical protein